MVYPESLEWNGEMEQWNGIINANNSYHIAGYLCRVKFLWMSSIMYHKLVIFTDVLFVTLYLIYL